MKSNSFPARVFSRSSNCLMRPFLTGPCFASRRIHPLQARYCAGESLFIKIQINISQTKVEESSKHKRNHKQSLRTQPKLLVKSGMFRSSYRNSLQISASWRESSSIFWYCSDTGAV